MFADQSGEPADSRILEGFSLNDLHVESLRQYRNRFGSRGEHAWLAEDDLGLLSKLGGWRRDRSSGREGVTLAGLLMFISDVHSLGLQATQGMYLTTGFYWDFNDETRAWSKRFASANGGKYPTAVHAGVYAGVLHYLKAVDAGKTDDGTKAIAKMKEMPTDDVLFGKGSIRADGRKIHPVYLFEVKKPSESKGPYDYYKVLQTIPADKAFRPIDQGNCPLVAKK